jgi:two-component sensor histidine kinase
MYKQRVSAKFNEYVTKKNNWVDSNLDFIQIFMLSIQTICVISIKAVELVINYCEHARLSCHLLSDNMCGVAATIVLFLIQAPNSMK